MQRESVLQMLCNQVTGYVAVHGWDLHCFPVKEIPSPCRPLIECPRPAAALHRDILPYSLFFVLYVLETAIGAISDPELWATHVHSFPWEEDPRRSEVRPWKGSITSRLGVVRCNSPDPGVIVSGSDHANGA